MSNTKPTVLFVVVPAPLGGSNRSLLTLLKSLEGRVNRVVAGPTYGGFREVLLEDNLAEEFIDLPRRPRSVVDRWLRVVSGLKLAAWAIRNRRRLRAIHANAITGLNMSVPAAVITRARTVVWIHDPVGSDWGSRLGPVVKRLLPRLRIAAVSRTAESVAVEQGLCRPGDARLVPNPIDPDDVVAKRKENKPSVVIGLLGGATYRKGFDLLPEAVEGLKDRNVKWRLHVSNVVRNGDQPIWDELERHGETVQNVGKVVDVRRAYAEMDIVFCPSRNESFCRVAAEAMLNGLPVVASDIEPLRELLGEDEAGILFEVGNTDAAVSALRRLVDDVGLREEMGRSGQRRATIYRPEDVAGQMLKLYGIS